MIQRTTATGRPAGVSPLRLAVASFLARFTGATRRAYELESPRLHPSHRRSPVIHGLRVLPDAGHRRATDRESSRIRPPTAAAVRIPTLGLTHLQFEAMLVASRQAGPMPHAVIVLLGLLGLRVSEACAVNLEDLRFEHGHRVVLVHGKGGTRTLMPLPPVVARALDALAGDAMTGPLLRTRTGARMDRHAAARVVRRTANTAGIPRRVHPHVLRHAFVTTLLDAGVPLRDVQIAARHADPRTTTRYDRARRNLDRHAVYILAAYLADAS